MKFSDAYLLLLGLVLAGVVLWANIYFAKFFVRKALKKFVIPDLEIRGYKLTDHEWLGLFNSGNFKNDGWIQIRVPGSWTLTAIFANVDYDTDAGSRRVTIRIGVSLFVVEEVAYSHEL